MVCFCPPEPFRCALRVAHRGRGRVDGDARSVAPRRQDDAEELRLEPLERGLALRHDPHLRHRAAAVRGVLVPVREDGCVAPATAHLQVPLHFVPLSIPDPLGLVRFFLSDRKRVLSAGACGQNSFSVFEKQDYCTTIIDKCQRVVGKMAKISKKPLD